MQNYPFKRRLYVSFCGNLKTNAAAFLKRCRQGRRRLSWARNLKHTHYYDPYSLIYEGLFVCLFVYWENYQLTRFDPSPCRFRYLCGSFFSCLRLQLYLFRSMPYCYLILKIKNLIFFFLLNFQLSSIRSWIGCFFLLFLLYNCFYLVCTCLIKCLFYFIVCVCFFVIILCYLAPKI